jgi:hypothetical protein
MNSPKRWYDEDLAKAKKKTTIRHKQQLEEEWIKEQEEALEHIDEDQLGENESEIAHT